MNQQNEARGELHLEAREALRPSALHQLWRLESGALRLDSWSDGAPPTFVRLMLPGDLVGVEALAGAAPHIQVAALTASMLVPVALPEGKSLTRMWMDAVSQAHHRARDMASMRTGPTDKRVRRLLQALSEGHSPGADEVMDCTLPSLNDMARILNLAPETVCRALSNLRQSNVLRDVSPKPSKFSRLYNRSHNLSQSLVMAAS
nr:Crp/Fnr family transcriptional regulator [uncultured Rhodoferax sp.]